MGRVKLSWFNLRQQEGQDLCLKIPICEVYKTIIDRAFPNLQHIGWKPDNRGTCYTYIKTISPADEERLNDFLVALQGVICLTITDHLTASFSNELDEA